MKKLLIALVVLLLTTSAWAQPSGGGASLCQSPTGTKIPVACDASGGVTTIPTASTGRVCVSITPDTNPYQASDVVGGLQTISSVFRTNVNSGVLQSIAVTNTEIDGIPWRVCIFNADPTGSTTADQGNITLVAADLQKIIGCFSVSTGTAFVTSELYEANNIVKAVKASGTSVWATLQTTGAPTWAAAQTVNMCLTFLQD